ncbi:MAG TPA: hypothetical protein VEU96_03785 [Bryobacteraceae bacterium]|nr:hypothetical protein [Bryobacteraceae bacterium]
MSTDEPPYKGPVIDAYKKDVDRTLLRENLRLTVTERFEKLMALQRFAEEMRQAGRDARREKLWKFLA